LLWMFALCSDGVGIELGCSDLLEVHLEGWEWEG